MNTYQNWMIFRSILHLPMRGIQEKYQLPLIRWPTWSLALVSNFNIHPFAVNGFLPWLKIPVLNFHQTLMFSRYGLLPLKSPFASSNTCGSCASYTLAIIAKSTILDFLFYFLNDHPPIISSVQTSQLVLCHHFSLLLESSLSNLSPCPKLFVSNSKNSSWS